MCLPAPGRPRRLPTSVASLPKTASCSRVPLGGQTGNDDVPPPRADAQGGGRLSGHGRGLRRASPSTRPILAPGHPRHGPRRRWTCPQRSWVRPQTARTVHPAVEAKPASPARMTGALTGGPGQGVDLPPPGRVRPSWPTKQTSYTDPHHDECTGRAVDTPGSSCRPSSWLCCCLERAATTIAAKTVTGDAPLDPCVRRQGDPIVGHAGRHQRRLPAGRSGLEAQPSSRTEISCSIASSPACATRSAGCPSVRRCLDECAVTPDESHLVVGSVGHRHLTGRDPTSRRWPSGRGRVWGAWSRSARGGGRR